jgi:LCP family protein required for cell wall assembly
LSVQRPVRRRASLVRRPSQIRARLLVVFGFVLAGLVGAALYFLPLASVAASQTGQNVDSTLGSTGTAAPGKPFTVLLLGSDDDSKFARDRVLTQSMILVRVDPTSKQVTMLSIPRDLWVPLPSGHSAKIDLAYEEGGAQGAIDAVQRNFKVKVDEYAWIGLQGLVHLIDRLGGIDVVTSNPVLDDFYPADLNGGSPYGYARVAVLPGPQHLNGVNALEYVRSRHNDVREDFGRSARQQQVLLAIRTKAARLGVADLPDLAGTFSGEFKTSMTLARMQLLLPLARGFNSDGVKQVLLTPPYTSDEVVEGQQALAPRWDLILPVVHQAFP